MKKMYITPAVEMTVTEACQMMALSIVENIAADESPILVQEEVVDMDIWAED